MAMAGCRPPKGLFLNWARLFGRVEPVAGIASFDRLVGEVMATEPYRPARRVVYKQRAVAPGRWRV
jgi:hypothetical protein